MTADPFFDGLLVAWLGLAVVTAGVLLRISVPYGRYVSETWGPSLPARVGWVLMELPAVVVFGYFFLTGAAAKTWPMWVFFALWQAHYLHRGLVYPLRRRSGGRMPLLVAVSAFLFNLVNGYLNGHYLGTLADGYQADWGFDPRFAGGLLLFIAGAAVNLRSDAILRGLREPGESGYRIPRGRLFRYVSCPNYLGELIEWCGFALLTWSPTAAVFALWTAANLVPRALAHHRWYRQRFDEYPPRRRAIIPFVL